MKAKIFTVFVLLAVLAVTLSGPAMAQGPGTPEPPLTRRAEEGLGIVPSGVEGVMAAQQAQNVELVSQMGGCVYAVTLQGNYAYIGVGPRLVILNIADPAHPTMVGQTGVLPHVVEGVAVAGNYAYVAAGESGLRIINVADPAYPSEVGFYVMPGWAYGVAVSGSYAYVADGNSGLVILRLLRDKVMGSIPPTGGTLSSTSGDTRFLFPVDAVTQTITMVYRHLWTDQDTGPLTGIGHTFEVTAVYSDTGQPAQIAPGQNYTLTVHYTEAEKGPAIESTLALYYWDGNQWVQEPSSVLDTAANTVTAYPNHFSLWAVLGETKRVYLPLVLRNYR